jgi:hypothetical protein
MLGRPKLRPIRRFLGAVLRRTIWFTRQGFGCKCSLLIGAAPRGKPLAFQWMENRLGIASKQRSRPFCMDIYMY